MTINDVAVVKLLGGLALFLFGLRLFQEKMEGAFGRGLRFLVPLMRKNRVAGMLGGTIASGVLQDGSAVSAAAAGLCNAGYLNLYSAAGVMIGAGVGTAVTALLLTVEPALAAVFAAAGAVSCILLRRDRMRNIGAALLALSVMFGGVLWVSQSLEALRDWQGVTYLMLGMQYPALAVLLGAGVAAMLQSAVAVIGLAQVLFMQSLLPVETAVYVVLGANIGACLTTIMASAGTRRDARRSAVTQLLICLTGAAAVIIGMKCWPLTEYMTLLGSEKMQLALLHGAFNAALAIVFVLFAGLFGWIGKLFVHGGPEKSTFVFYDERVLNVPSFALMQLEKETQRLCGMNCERLQTAIYAWQDEAAPDISARACEQLEKEVTAALLQLSRKNSSECDGARIQVLLQAVQQSTRMGSHAQRVRALREICGNVPEDAQDDLLLLLHKAVNMADMAQQALWGRKMSGEKMKSMQLMAGDAAECAQEARMHHAAQTAEYLEALHEAAYTASCAGNMV